MARTRLREDVEARLEPGGAGFPADVAAEHLLHELRQHQAELEMQNGALLAALTEMERAQSQASDYIRSVLDAMEEAVAVLDREGIIRAVNTSWRRYSVANSATPGVAAPGTGVGANYLRACEPREPAKAHPDAIKARDGILAVMQGRLASFSMEYPCDSPDVKRWFSLKVTPLDAPEGGVVTAHLDITARKSSEEQLRIAAISFESQQCAMLTDTQGRIVRVNRAFSELTGYGAEEAVGRRPSMLSSGRHDREFYEQMWTTLTEKGSWKGEIWNRRKDGRLFVAWVNISAVIGAGGTPTHYLGTYLDHTDQKEAALEIHRLENYDALTGLPNRRSCFLALDRAIAASATSGRHGALLLLDLDNFKNLNDTLGHAMGDRFLTELANRLSDRVRECDTVARNGGDEYWVIFPDLGANALEAAARASDLAQNLRDRIAQPWIAAEQDLRITACMGVAMFGGAAESAETLMKNADLALHQAKAAGPDGTCFFEVGLQTALLQRTSLESDLRRAVADGQFHLEYQPQVDRRGCVVGAEALLRWAHPVRGPVPPDEFIPLAEETGLILPIGAWVLEKAAQIVVQWAADPLMRHLRLAVNVSARQIQQPDFVQQIEQILARAGADARLLKIELTESVVLHDIDDTLQKMTALKALGISFSLDDFGTGYSSLAYLARLPLDQLKIDRSFVRNLPDGRSDAVMAQTIIAMANGLGLDVISEGVETVGQREFLEQHGCHSHQGYLFSRPLPLAQFAAFVRAAVPATHPAPA